MQKRIPSQARVSFLRFFGKKQLALVLVLSIMLLPAAFGQTTGLANASSLTSPEPTASQTPGLTVTPSQPPANASQTTSEQSPASTLPSTKESKNGGATSFEGYLILVVALTVLVMVLTVIVIILRRCNHWAITADVPLRRLSEL
jgi:hypothetical protein